MCRVFPECAPLRQCTPSGGGQVKAQAAPEKPSRLTFEVATIKPSEPGLQSGMINNRPSIFEGVKDQLGLQLTPAKGPVEYYVIDHIEKPSPN
jgi:hypothetical protein